MTDPTTMPPRRRTSENTLLRAIAASAEDLVLADDWREVLDDVLRRLGTAAAVDRCSVVGPRDDGPHGGRLLRVVAAWHADPDDGARDDPRLERIDYDAMGLGRWVDRLTDGEVLAGRTEEFPEGEAATLRALDVVNLAVAPVHADDGWWGALSLEDSSGTRTWAPQDLDALRAVARLLGESVARRRAAVRLAERTAELERSNRELEQFAYVASHDLQEPLRMVTSFMQLLQQRYEGQLDETADTYIHYAVDGAQRMQSLIHELLAFSRVGTRGGDPVPVVVDETLADVLTDLGPLLEETGGRVTSGALPTVLADPPQLRQMLQNLITNAVRFSHDEPRISVTAEPDERPGWWRVAVGDEGIGIAPEHRERIFDLFKRLHARDEYPGTGMGLATCRKIVERHGGTIHVEPSPSGGSSFVFTLPSAQEHP